MKAQIRSLRVLLLLVGIAVFGSAQLRCNADDRPGAKEQAEVDNANAELDRVYRDLMSKAEPEEKTSLQEAERAWIKWRDAEAMYIARHGGAVGGSSLRIDYAVAQLKLINERSALLKEYLAQAPQN